MPMVVFVASGAEGDEVWFRVVSESAPRADVVDLELGCASAVLAAPAVALQHLMA